MNERYPGGRDFPGRYPGGMGFDKFEDTKEPIRIPNLTEILYARLFFNELFALVKEFGKEKPKQILVAGGARRGLRTVVGYSWEVPAVQIGDEIIYISTESPSWLNLRGESAPRGLRIQIALIPVDGGRMEERKWIYSTASTLRDLYGGQLNFPEYFKLKAKVDRVEKQLKSGSDK